MGRDTGRVSVAAGTATSGQQHAPEVVAVVRGCVRGLLEQSDAFAAADPDLRRAVAQKMVKVALVGVELAQQDLELSREIAAVRSATARERRPVAMSAGRQRPAPIAAAQAAGDQLGMQATRAAAGTLTALKNAIDFPTFVTSLINGVFQAVTSSSITQLTGLSDLLDNVTASADSFTEQNVRDEDVVRWAVGKFPFLTRSEGGLAVREGDDLTQHTASLKEGLDASEAEVSGIDPSDLMMSLGPFAKRKMGRDRQQILGTLVQMGLQRIVVDEGRLHASMDMRVDTRSVSEQDKAARTDIGVEAKASGSFGVGPWSVGASVGTSFSQVNSDQQYTKEEIDARAGLRSSVDLAFRTEQIPLDRMADSKARVKLDLNARVPASVSEGPSLISSERNVGIVSAPTYHPSADAPAKAKPVEEKKPEPPKKPPVETKTAPKKPDEKKPPEAKPEVKKPLEKQPDGKQPPGKSQPPLKTAEVPAGKQPVANEPGVNAGTSQP